MPKQNKTIETKSSVTAYINKIKDEKRRKDFSACVALLKKQSGFDPKMWGPGIVGFGSYHYKYESGREGDSCIIGLASRVNAITFYIGHFEKREELLAKLGKHKISGGCLHIQKLEDVDVNILTKMVKLSIANTKKTWKC